MSKKKDLLHRVRAMERMDLADLRTEWRRLYGEPPTMRSAELLRRMLAWRVQADQLGGFDAATRRMLETGKAASPPPVHLPPGTRLARIWKGRRIEVTVTEDAVVMDGVEYGSLSELATKITGTRWNGLRFFGVRSSA
ncbi:DUF2924 domain-containing protein [Sphingosinicella rhizophila]|uniref:DUF2924 domain-containing protein n=1 Tax=Sphingosinicella rhizophila TaxID=3050082 RepID=A0ABU3Q3D7_9SPHN|nr:DUF2924 domain-containing protein [Sphingosinicella sp. GR2756]MDT9597922.1 DUF2924 domain-containing protein [Sphingosinicella sp. GR2756]